MYQKLGVIPDGGDQCNIRNIELTKDICGAENVDFYYINKGDTNKFIDAISFYKNIFNNFYRGITYNKIQEIIKLSRNFECIFLCSSLFGAIGKALKDSGYKGKIITQFHNVEYNYYNVVFPKLLPLRNRVLKCIYTNERMSAEYSDVTLALNERDGSLIEHNFNIKISHYDPITLADKLDIRFVNEELTRKKPICAFIGSNFPPNAEGVLWFTKNVLPHVNIDFIVVGRNMDVLKKENDILKNIEVKSNVPDLSDYFFMADFIVSPIFSGSGMKVKTCEGLMYGKNILGTNEAFEGYSLDYSKVGGLCNTATEYIDTINNYIANPIRRFNEYSRNVYVSRYSNQTIRNTFNNIY